MSAFIFIIFVGISESRDALETSRFKISFFTYGFGIYSKENCLFYFFSFKVTRLEWFLYCSIISKIGSSMQSILQSGTILKTLKQAKVTPIFKNGSQQNCSDYRPISLLSNISKITEKLIHKQLYGFLEINNCLYAHQCGFRNQHSSIHALITKIEKMQHALGNGKLHTDYSQIYKKHFTLKAHGNPVPLCAKNQKKI